MADKLVTWLRSYAADVAAEDESDGGDGYVECAEKLRAAADRLEAAGRLADELAEARDPHDPDDVWFLASACTARGVAKRLRQALTTRAESKPR